MSLTPDSACHRRRWRPNQALAGAARDVDRWHEVPLLVDRLDQDIASDHQRGQRVGLVLTGLSADRRALQLWEVPGDPRGAGLKALEQRRRPGQGTAAGARR